MSLVESKLPRLEKRDAGHWRLATERPPLWVRSMLGALVSFFLLFPLMIMALAYFWIPGISPWSALWSLVLCWSVAYFFLRLFLWNAYGAEGWQLQEQEKRLVYQTDYRLFQSDQKTLALSHLQTRLQPSLAQPHQLFHLVLSDGKTVVESIQALAPEAWQDLRAAIATAQGED